MQPVIRGPDGQLRISSEQRQAWVDILEDGYKEVVAERRSRRRRRFVLLVVAVAVIIAWKVM